MARIRSVKPEYWTSEQVMNMSRDARLLFIGLWNFCDDNGVHPASPKSLKAEVFPGDDLTADTVMALVDEMIEQGLVEEYEADARTFWRVTGWKRHQRIDQPTYRYPTGDAGDTGDASDTRVTRVTKRLGGKQRQIVLDKLRHRDGDACHLCGDSSSLSIYSAAPENAENPHELSFLRLICPTCKRKHKHGDAKKQAGDTGDAKSLEGDSTTERRGVEWNGEDRNGDISTQQAAHGDSTVVGAGDAKIAPLPKREEAPPSNNPAIVMAVALRRLGVQATFTHPAIQTWVAEGVSMEVLTEAVAKARETKGPSASIPANYLVGIVHDIRNPPPAATPKTREVADNWWTSDAGIDRKGRELGMLPKPTENYASYKDRIFEELRRRGGKAA